MNKRFAQGLVQADVSGSGPSVWLLHSLLADAGSFRPLARALAGTHRVVLPDLPGFGGSAPAEGLAGAAARIADGLAEDMAETGAPAAVVGNGYGSFVALMAALRRPDLVSRLVLAGAGAAFDEAGQAAFRAMASAAAAKGLEATADTAMKRLFSPAFQAENPDLVASRRERFLATDPAVFARACDDLATVDLRSEAPGLQPPLFVVVGDSDEATPPAMANELAGLVPGARFMVLKGLAHVPQLQDTARFMEAVGAFLAAPDPVAASDAA